MTHRITICMEDNDLNLIDEYCKAHNLKRSNFIVKSCFQVIEAQAVLDKMPEFVDLLQRTSEAVFKLEKQSKSE